MIDATIQQGVEKDTPSTKVRNPELVWCFKHESEDCPRCDGSGYRHSGLWAGCGAPAARPSQDGKALICVCNRRGRDQPFYCLGCHPELGRGPVVLEGMGD